MLTEHFVASTFSSGKVPTPSALKDVGIHIHEFQPSSAARSGFKKSSTLQNCLAVNASHVFAAQANKAVVHVYSRERGNQEAIIPFQERIHCLALAGNENGAGILVLGTESGRLILWETCTGRQISTSASHLQPVTSVVIDPTSNFIVSGSSDTNLHVWSLPGLISFSKSSFLDNSHSSTSLPIRTLSNHRSPITTLAIGHSRNRTNFVISASRDETAILWDYHTGTLLRTFLLSSTPLCLSIDPADRAFYAGYEDGSVQVTYFFDSFSPNHAVYDMSLQSTPVQPSSTGRWTGPSPETGAAQCLALSYGGTALLSGHLNGKILSWDIARGKYTTIADLTHSVTNLQMLRPTGFPSRTLNASRIGVHNVVKPRFDHGIPTSNQTSGSIPANYTFTAHISSSSLSHYVCLSESDSLPSGFSRALDHPFFPPDLISDGLVELTHKNPTSATPAQTGSSSQLDGAQSPTIPDDPLITLQRQNTALETEIQSLEKNRRHATTKLVELSEWNYDLRRSMEKTEKVRGERAKRKEERALMRRERFFELEKQGKGEVWDEAMRMFGGGGSVSGETDKGKGGGLDAQTSSSDEMTGSD